MVLFINFPDTPRYLYVHDKKYEAEQSLQFYSSNKCNLINKNDETERFLKSTLPDVEIRIKFSDFCVPTTIKAIIIGMVGISMVQLSGSRAISNYAAIIFAAAGTDIPPNVCAVIIGIIALVASIIAISLVDTLGRRV